MIKRLEGLERLERLTTLHLRDNQLNTLDGLSPNMKCLLYLNIRYTLITIEHSATTVINSVNCQIDLIHFFVYVFFPLEEMQS